MVFAVALLVSKQVAEGNIALSLRISTQDIPFIRPWAIMKVQSTHGCEKLKQLSQSKEMYSENYLSEFGTHIEPFTSNTGLAFDHTLN